MSDTLLASVIICTRNRADSLARTLASVRAAARNVTDAWELLIIDNGSSDHTDAVIARFRTDLPIRSVLEPDAGLSNARNAGLAAAQGQYIIWTDDDVLVDDNWLNAYFSAFRSNPDDAIFGGASTPRYLGVPRRWFAERERDLASLLAIRNSPEWHAIDAARVPFGLNYAFRAPEQRLNLYDPALGVAPGRRRGGEETAAIRSALAAGSTGKWIWDAKVYHLIGPERQTLRYVFEYYLSNGYDWPILPLAEAGLRIRGVPLRLVKMALRKALSCLARAALGQSSWVASFVGFARSVGTISRFRAEAVRADGDRQASRSLDSRR